MDLSNTGFLGIGVDEDQAKWTNDVLDLMARNYAIVEELQGHEVVTMNVKYPGKSGKKTIGDFVAYRLKASQPQLLSKLKN